MKKKIKMVSLSRNELKKLNLYTGGCISIGGGYVPASYASECFCGCYYAGEPGGSSSDANDGANDSGGGLHSVPR